MECYELVNLITSCMETKTYDLTLLIDMISCECNPKEIADSLNDVLYEYIIVRMESGDCGHQDAVNVLTVKNLIRVFSSIKNC